MLKKDIVESYKKHAALAQFHRWYLLYENADYGLANTLDILTPEIIVKSGLGEAHGHEEYAARVGKLPGTWKNAHELKNIDVVLAVDDSVQLTADITYCNQGMLAGGKIRVAELTYRCLLRPTEDLLPKFDRIEITQNKEGEAEAFVSMYARNRVMSLAHYWFALIEGPARDPEPVKEILADGFSLNFSRGPITDFDGFEKWLTGPAAQFSSTAHVLSKISVQSPQNNEFLLTFETDWGGILPDDTEMTVKTRHAWTVVDNPSHRFARIKSVNVEVLEPLRPKV
jgi:hypothetical protein